MNRARHSTFVLSALTLATVGGCGAIVGFDSEYRTAPTDAGADADATLSIEIDAGDASDAQRMAEAEPENSGRIEFSSCLGLPRECGPDGNGDCCASVLVPGGAFNRFNNPAANATVSAFRLDVYEVTVGRYSAFIEHGWSTQQNPPPSGAGSHFRTENSGWQNEWARELPTDIESARSRVAYSSSTYREGTATRPINGIGWTNAFAFCAWDGGRLPTVAEWSFAATGGDEQRYFPWSISSEDKTIDATYASYKEDTNIFCNGDGMNGCDVTDLISVGTRPKGNGRWGHADLSGNVSEWLIDGTERTPTVPCDNCMIRWDTERAHLGGSYKDVVLGLVNGSVAGEFWLDTQVERGFRCARPAK